MARSGRFNHEMLRRIRQELSLTQEDAARLVGTDVRTWRRYESGAVSTGGFTIRTAKRRALLTKLCDELGVARIEDWLVAPSVGHRLPPAPRLVGRETELAQVHRWLDDGDGVIAVTGIGGMGKTSLIQRAIVDRPALVWSLYDDPRLERLFDALLAHLGRSAPPGQREDALLVALPEQPTLIVLDGLEVVQSAGTPDRALGELTDPTLRRLLRRIAQGGVGTALCTSRLPLVDLQTRHLPLSPLSADATHTLLTGMGITEDRARQAAALCGGHALSAAMVGAYVVESLGGDPTGLESLPLAEIAEDEPLARRLLAVLRATAARLKPAERDLMARVALFPGGVTLKTLRWIRDQPALAGSLLGLTDAGLRRLLARLTRRGLLHTAGPERWSCHPFIRQGFRRLPDTPREALVAALADGVRLDHHHTESPQARDRDEEALHTLLAADRPDAALTLYHRALGGFGVMGLQAGEWVRGARLLSAFSPQGSPAHLHPALTDRQKTAVAYDWGLFAGGLGDLPQALRCYRACLAYAAALEPSARRRHEATAHRTLAYTLRLAGRTDEALAAIARSLARCEHPWDRMRGMALHAALLHDAGDHHSAGQRFDEAEALLGRAPTARWGLWRAEHLRDIGATDAARILTRANLHHCIAQGWQGHVAHCRLTLGLLLPPAEARAQLTEARRWIDRTGEAEQRLAAMRLQATIAAAEGDRQPARDALRAAADLGLGWFTPRLSALL